MFAEPYLKARSSPFGLSLFYPPEKSGNIMMILSEMKSKIGLAYLSGAQGEVSVRIDG